MNEPVATGGSEAEHELACVARIMSEHRLDSVEMPSGLKVLKTTHAPYAEASPSPDAVDEAATRRLEALGLVNATDESGRLAVEQDDVLFAASRAPELDLNSFRPEPGVPQETADDRDE